MPASPKHLERHHQPLGRLFPPPESDRDSYRLDEEKVAFFHEHGYVKGGRVLTGEDRKLFRLE